MRKVRHQDLIEDLQERIPKLTEDFHHPCPKCGATATILATASIRRTRCTKCRQELALDKRIGGQLCLLPIHTGAEKASLEEIEGSRRLRLRLLSWVATILLLAAAYAALTVGGIGWALLGGMLVVLFLLVDRDEEQDPPRRSRRARRRRLGLTKSRRHRRRRRRQGGGSSGDDVTTVFGGNNHGVDDL